MLPEPQSCARKTRVLMLTTGHEATDARIYAKQAARLQRLGLDVTVVGKLEYTRPGAVPIVPIAPARSRWQRLFWQPWRCIWAARRLDADIVHFHDPEMLLALPLARLWWRKSKFVYDVHEDNANLMLIRDWLPRWARRLARAAIHGVEQGFAGFADAIVGVTPPLTAKFRHRHKTVAYNFVPKEFFTLAAGQGARERAFDVIHVGTLNASRANFLAEVLREFHRQKPRARSLVAGVAPALEKLLAGILPAQTRVLPRMSHREISAHLGGARIGLDVHPEHLAHLEVALPVKVCEYMAAGCAVVSSTMPVLSELVQSFGAEAEGLILIDDGAAADYAAALAALSEEIEAGADPGARLRELAARHLCWEGEADKITALYAELLGHPCVA